MCATGREVPIGITEEKIQEGTHLCYIFNDDRERGKTMAKFVEQGLVGGDRVLCLLDAATPHDIRGFLRELGVDLSARENAFLTGDAETTYCPSGKLDLIPLLEGLGAFCRQSVEAGFAGARITGDMSWVIRTKTSMEDFWQYELKATDYSKTNPVIAVCEYDARKFDGATIMDILNVHPAMIVRGQIVKNPYYMDPQTFLAQYRMRAAGGASV